MRARRVDSLHAKVGAPAQPYINTPTTANTRAAFAVNIRRPLRVRAVCVVMLHLIGFKVGAERARRQLQTALHQVLSREY